jgi:hypothetical protein
MRALARARIPLPRLSHEGHLASGSLVTESTAHLGPSDNYGLLRSQPGNTEIRGLPRVIPGPPKEVQYHVGARAP